MLSRRSIVVAMLGAAMLASVFLYRPEAGQAQGQENQLIPVTTASDERRDSENPSISGDGRYIVFHSDASFGRNKLPDNQFEIWLFDTLDGSYQRLTTASAGNKDSFAPIISGDGSHVVFRSNSNFTEEEAVTLPELWLYNIEDDAYQRLTTASDRKRTSFDQAINGDGTRVVFTSDSDFNDDGIEDNQFQIWLYDNEDGLTPVSRPLAANRDSQRPSISSDGSFVVFQSDEDFLEQGIGDNQFEIWLYEVATDELSRITFGDDEARSSYSPSISGDGKIITFFSDEDFLDEGIEPGQYEVWLYFVDEERFARVTTASDPRRRSIDPQISEDGGTVLFASDSNLFDQGIRGGQFEFWVYNLRTGGYTRISQASDIDRTSENATLSSGGQFAVFDSDSDMLDLGTPLDQYEVWLFVRP